MPVSRYALSLLDLVCCALGAMLVILIISSGSSTGKATLQKRTLLIMCRQISGPGREVAIRYREPGTSIWRSANLVHECEYEYVSFRQKTDQLGIAYLLIEGARPGTWSFHGFQSGSTNGNNLTPGDIKLFRLSKTGYDGEASKSLDLPSRRSDELSVFVER